MSSSHTRLSIRPALALAMVSAALAAVQVAAAPSAVAAAGPDPASVERTLAPGAVSTFPVTVGTPTVAPNPDIVFLADTTGSMQPALANVSNNIRAIMSDVLAAQPNARFGVAEYKEERNTRRFHVNTSLTDETDVVVGGTQDWLFNVGGGGDPWTDFINAHYQIATGAFGFRPASTRIVAWFGAAQSHDPSLGHTLGDTSNRLRENGVRVVAVPVTGTPAPGLDALGQATSITTATDGVLMPPRSASEVSTAILDGIHALTVRVEPTPSCDPQLSLSSDPARRTVGSGTDAAFTETVTVADDAAPGTYTCTVDFRVGGVSAGYTQTVTVHVPGTTPPAVNVDDVSVPEGDAGTSPMEFTVTLDRPSPGPVTVQWATADGTAAAPDDFAAASGEVTFSPGTVSRPVTVQVRGDTIEESDETFRVDLSDPTGAVIGDESGAGTILNDDDGSPVNQPPVAADDSYAMSAGASLSIDVPGVLSNDTDPDGDALHALHQAGPYHGTLTLNDDGSFTYVPTPGYVGSDTFTYRAYDGSLVSAPATVTVHTRDYRVDAMIRAGGPYIGDDVYNASADQQRAGRFARRGTTATYSVRIENDSTSAPDSFRVAGALGSRGFTVGYFDGGQDVTSEVLAGTWTTPTLQPGQAHVLTVQVDVAGNAPLLGSSTSLINVSSTGDPSIMDAVETATWTL